MAKKCCVPCKISVEQELPKPNKDPVENTKPTVPENNNQPTDTSLNTNINTVKCGVPITAITKVGDKVIVTFADCTYAVADSSVVAKEVFSIEALTCVINSIKELKNNQKDSNTAITEEIKPEIITIKEEIKTVNEVINTVKESIPTPYDDTSLRNKISELEARTDKDTVYDDTIIQNKLTALENSLNTVLNKLNNIPNEYIPKDWLVQINNLEGEYKFRAIKKEND